VGSTGVTVVHKFTISQNPPDYPEGFGVAGAILTLLAGSADSGSGGITELKIPGGVEFVLEGLAA
jgi:hypothetical protein